MTAIITDYAARRFAALGDTFGDVDPEKYLRFTIPLGEGFCTLDAAGMLDREYVSNYEYGGEFKVSTTIKYTPSALALNAFKNLSGDAQFVGGFKEFVDKLTDYARLWQDAIYQLDIYPDEPYLSKSRIGFDDYYYYDWSGQRIPTFCYSKMKPALEDVIRWASDDHEFERLYYYVKDTGIDSYVEALSEGVPLEDILA